jgi:predicted MPP superfamily phosphohydrolase
VFLLFCTTIIYDILRVILKKTPISNSRRKFFKKSLDFTSLVLATAVSARALYEARHITIEKVPIKLQGLKKSYKIVQLSDVHIGGLIDAKFIRRVVDKVNKLQAEIVVITGDLVDIKLSEAKEALEELKNLQSKYGTYFVVGNHEYIHGVEEIIKTVKSLDITVLENESIYIGEDKVGFNLAGVYDVMGYRADKYKPDLQKALGNIEEHSPTVLLAHQPRYIDEVKSGVDLMLSGHTHGGQLYPFRILVKLVQPYISGLYQHNKQLQIYVNRGTGFWGPPMRLGASPEISEIIIEGTL